MPILNLNGMGDGESALTDAVTDGEGGGGDCGCGSSMCAKTAAAASSAQQALGPAAKPIASSIISSLANDKSPAGQAQYQASTAYNAQVNSDNASRQAIIDQFVKAAIGGKVTATQMKMGDKAKAAYKAMVNKYGPDVKSMTLAEVVAKYPEDSQAIVNSIGEIYPAMKGKSYQDLFNNLNSVFKGMTLNDLEALMPDSSWASLGVPATSGGIAQAVTSPLGMTGIAIAGIGIAAVLYVATKKKGTV